MSINSFISLKNLIIYLFSFVLLGIWSGAYSQSYEHVAEIFTKDHGLPDEYIKDIDVDSYGNIWILTRRGMVKFNGTAFETINIDPNLPIDNFKIDVHDNLWLKISRPRTRFDKWDQLQIYNSTSSQLLSLEEYCSFAELDNSQRILIWKDERNNIFFHYRKDNAFYYNGDRILALPKPYTRELINIQNKKALELSYTNATWDTIFFQHMNTQNIVSYADKGIFQYIWKDDEIVIKSYFHTKEEALEEWTAHNGITFISSQNDTLAMNTTNRLKYVFIDNDFYYATANDLRVYNLQSRKISDLSDLIDPLLSNAEFLKLVAEDQNLWIATTEGLIRLEKKKKIFQPLLAGANISTREMYAISEDSILLCTERGLYLVDSRTNKVQDVLNEKEEFYGISRLSDANYLLGIYGPGSYVVNLEKGTLDKKIYKNEKDFRVKTKESHLNSILDENGRLWLSGNKGICTYDSVANGLKCYHFDEEANIYCHEITDGREKQHLFLLTHAGLLDFDVQTYRYKQYESLKSKAISFITKDLDHDSIYWVATKYEGLLKWEYDGKVMDVINVEDGLGHNNVHSVFEDNHKRLWLSTDYGISVYNKETKEISVITEENGIHENEMNRHSHCFVNDSLILYGSINGVIKFNPYDVQFDATFGELNLKALSFRNRSENVLESIPIKKDESKLTIRRNQEDPKLLFDIPEKSYSNTLRYLFSSGDKDWTYTQGNSIDLSTIKDGQTNLFVSKKTGINEWSSPSTIAIYKPVPFYKAYWFYGLLFCLFSIGALIYINQRRVRAIKLNKRISREVEMKTKELYHKNQSLTESKRLNEQLFTIIGHDLRSPLISLNNISKSLNYLTARGEYEEVKKLSQTIESNSKKSLNIIDRLIDWTEKQKSSMLELHKVLLVGCIQKSVGEHQEFADKKNIEIKVEAKQAVVCISNESSLMVVLGNVIANAIKFSPRNSEITIDVDHRGAEIVIEVKDQGIGMDSEQLHKLNNAMPVEPILSTEGEAGLGMGLLLSAEIIKKIKGHMEFFSEKGKGTSVLIKLPQ